MFFIKKKFNWSQVKPNEIEINQININPEILGRTSLRQDAVEFYADLLESGTKLKPIKLQKNTNLLIGGWHRIHAAKKVNLTKFPALVGEVPDRDLRLEAFLDNQDHGVQYNKEERNNIVNLMYRKDGKTQEEISQVFGISQQRVGQILGINGSVSNTNTCNANTISETLADKRRKLTDQELETIAILTLQGELSSNIAKKLISEGIDVSESRIRQIKAAKIDEIRKLYRQGKGKLKIAEDLGLSPDQLDEYLVSDTDIDPLDFELPVFTWWPAFGLDSRQTKYPGAIPVQLIKNLLAVFSEPKSHIVDIFSGGGTTAIACNDMISRTCELFDLVPINQSIKYHSIVNNNKQVDLPNVERKPEQHKIIDKLRQVF